MKTLLKLTALAFLSAFSLPLSAFGQGSLTPPGAPAAGMKSLDQVYAKLDPRTPIGTNTTPGNANNLFIINQPGSYYLTTNLITTSTYAGNGIEILVNNVTLDLNGFSVSCSSTNTSTLGLDIPNTQTNIVVRNGMVNGWWNGVVSASGDSSGLVFEKLNVANCNKGAPYYGYGFALNGPAVIRDCTAVGNGIGINCNGNVSLDSSLITGCTANDNVFSGIVCSGGGIISGCTANKNTVGIKTEFNAYGYSTSDGCLITKCAAANNSGYGIYVYGARNRIENNHLVNNTYNGIFVDSSGISTNNIIIGNSSAASPVNYSIPSGEITGPIITATGIITNSNPWANFSF